MTRWAVAALAADLFARDPVALGGLRVVARAGPVRDAFLRRLPPARKLPLGVCEGALSGEIDLAATLAAGRPVRRPGLLDAPGPLLLPSAERCAPDLAARLGQALDAGNHALIALDEGEDETPPPALLDRLGLVVDLDGLRASALDDAALADLYPMDAPVADPIAHLSALAAALGVGSLRAPLIAARAARLAAAGGPVTEAHCALAAELVLAPRATRLPAPEEAAPAPEATPDAPAEGRRLEDRVLDAIRPALPADLLAALATGRAPGAKGQGAGAKRRGNRRGRPLPPRAGRPDGRARIDLVATLRAAAPWQRLRGGGPGAPVRVRGADIRLKRAERRSDRLVIFAVDASGSAAAGRMAEAKGAVELLLAEAYARRDHVALIGFRGDGAELLLPPTRSLARTKKRLAGLPGGGGTPLAAGLREGATLAHHARARGMAPALVVLTDGRPNVALDGAGGRPRALADAQAMGRRIRADGLAGLVIDTGARPSAALADLAAGMGAACLPLPRADAGALSRAVAAAL